MLTPNFSNQNPRINIVLQQAPDACRNADSLLTVVNAHRATAHGTSCNSGDAHRCEWPPDTGFGIRKKAVNAWYRQCFSDFQSTHQDEPGHRETGRFHQQVHWVSPLTKFSGKSSVLGRSLKSIFLALVELLKMKFSGATSASLFQPLI